MTLDHPPLVASLRMAYSAEKAASFAYIGHAGSLKNPEEKVAVKQIEQEEWDHRRNVLEIMQQYDIPISRYYEIKYHIIGKIIGFSCYIIGRFMPYFFAGKLESGNVCEYFTMIKYFHELDITEHDEVLYEMGIAEKKHEVYFLEVIKDAKWLPLFEKIFSWGSSTSLNDVDLENQVPVEQADQYCAKAKTEQGATANHHKVLRRQFSLAALFAMTTLLALALGLLRFGLETQVAGLSSLALLLGGVVVGIAISFFITDTSWHYWLFTLAAWAMFALSLLLPAIDINLGSWGNPNPRPRTIPGLVCAYAYWPFWASNGFMALAPLLSYLQLRFLSRWSWIRWGIGILFAGSFFFATMLYYSEEFLSVHSGYILWSLSFLLMSIAFFIKPRFSLPSERRKPRREAKRLWHSLPASHDFDLQEEKPRDAQNLPETPSL